MTHLLLNRFEGSFMPTLYNQVMLCVARHDRVAWRLARIARFANGRVCGEIAIWLSSAWLIGYHHNTEPEVDESTSNLNNSSHEKTVTITLRSTIFPLSIHHVSPIYPQEAVFLLTVWAVAL
jgi:hypothetical protein